ncbi:peptide ABC transporter substrate-binding protein [Caloranaerobacter sp. DY30410]|uniref:peptide ABC transporter substrate-binding protein n=1 Tax=Caloranaerobacter sp. DY30410 TaxID=3238305 RepID=UPI003D054671
MKTTKKLLVIFLTMTMIMSLFVGCDKSGNDTKVDNEVGVTDDEKKDADEKEEESQKEENVVKVYRDTNSKTKTLNPHIYETTAEGDTMMYVYGNLLEMITNESGDSYELFPFHAKELPKRNEDGTVWTVKLRDNIKWDDGTPINAHSYVYSYKMLLDPKLKNHRANVFFGEVTIKNAKKYWEGKAKWEEVGIKALDDYTLQFELEFPVPEMDFYLLFTDGGATSPVHEKLYEAGMNEDRTETNYGTSLETTPSCGAYKLEEWIRDQYKVYVKRPDTPLSDIYVPDRIEERVVEEASTALQLFESEQIDTTSVSGTNYEKYEEDPRLVFAESTTVWSMFINMTSETNPILKNKDFRKALFWGMDRNVIAKDIMKTAKPAPYVVASGKIAVPSKGLRYRDTDAAKSILPKNNGYDPDLAKEYFEKAYKANGNKQIIVEIQYFDTSENLKKIAEFLEESYENLFGKDKLDIKLRAVPWQGVYENMENGKFDIAFGGWAGSRFNPWSGMEVYTSEFTNKIDKFYNKKFDELWERTTKGDLIFKEKERLEALAEMEKMLLDEVPFSPMFESRAAVLFLDRIKLKTGGKYIPGDGFAVLQADIVD